MIKEKTQKETEKSVRSVRVQFCGSKEVSWSLEVQNRVSVASKKTDVLQNNLKKTRKSKHPSGQQFYTK